MDNQNRVIFISSGEISGDIHAADLINNILSLDKNIKFVGIGGQKMLSTDFDPIDDDTSYMSTVGFLESLRFYKKKLKLLNKSVSFLKSNKVDLVILVDNQGFNIPLAKASHKMGLKTIYYFPPHVSIWGKWNASVLSEICDLIIVPFYQDYEIYKQYTDKVFYSGNPLIDKVNQFKFQDDFYSKYNLNKNNRIIGLFPGSRFQEIETLLPTMLDAAKLLYLNHNFQIILSLSHPIYKDLVIKLTKNKGLLDVIKIVQNDSYSCIKVSDVLIMASGTAVYEASLLRKPAIVCYKVSNLTYFIGKILVKKNYISLPNIINNKEIYPELIQHKFTINNIINYTLYFINFSSEKKNEYENYYKRIYELSGTYPVVRNVSEKVLEVLHKK